MPSRRPGWTLIIAGVVSLLAIAGATRLRSDVSLDAMFPRHDPAADAMVQVLNHFRTTDELLVVASLPPSRSGADPRKLIDYAQRLAQTVEKSPEARGLVNGVQYRAGDEARQFIEREIAPAGLFYLSDAQFAQAAQRLTPAGMRAQLARDRELLEQPGPAASALAKTLVQDPLGLHEFLMPELASARLLDTYQDSDALISPDGRAILIRVFGTQPPTAVDYATKLMLAIQQCAEAARPGDLNVSFGGGYAIADVSASLIRRDSIESIIESVVLLLIVFVVAFRRPMRMFNLAMAPIAAGILWGFGLYGWLIGNVSPIAAVIGGVLAGMGIDYSVLYLTRFESLRREGLASGSASERTLGQIGPALLAAFVTSVAGFVATGASSIAALRDFSILGTLGLGGSFLAALFVLPALLRLMDSGRTPADAIFRFNLTGPMDRIVRHRGIAIAACAVILAVSLAVALWPGPGVLQYESNLDVLQARPNAALQTDAQIERQFGISEDSLIVLLRARSSAALVSLAHRVAGRLAAIKGAPGSNIAGTYGLSTWLADPAMVDRRNDQRLRLGSHVVSDFQAAVKESGFNPSAFRNYENFLRVLMNQTAPPGIQALARYPELSRNLLPVRAAANEAVTVVFLRHSPRDRQERDRTIGDVSAALGGLDGVTLTGLSVVSHDAEDAVHHELPKLLAAAAGIVIVYLGVHFRRLDDIVLTLLPGLVGMSVLAAFVRLAGVRLNMANLVALPLLIGIDVDYGIYLVSLARLGRAGGSRAAMEPQELRAVLASAMYAVIVCASSMAVGYASLFFTSVAAIRSLGICVVVGVVACVIGTMGVVFPIVSKGERANSQEERSIGA